MPLLIILAVPVVGATIIATACCILAGRRERAFEDPALDAPWPAPASADPAPVPPRLATRPGHTKI